MLRDWRAAGLAALFSFVVIALSAGCHVGIEKGSAAAIVADSVRLAPIVGAFRLKESSSAAVSRRHAGVVYTHNDSGNEPMLYAFDTTGRAMGRWVMRKISNRDWEAAAVGPCLPMGTCVYLGDVGDNGLDRDQVIIYRVPEPEISAGQVGELYADSLVVRYADGPHNVEAMVYAPDGALLLMTKEVQRSPTGSRRPTAMYRVDPSAWQSGEPAVARLVDSLPIIPGAALREQVTDAALSADGRVLAVRTYGRVWLFAADSTTGRPHPGAAPVICDVTRLAEPQGEGVGILAVREGAVRLVFTSEGNGEPLRLANCPSPLVPAPTGSPVPAPDTIPTAPPAAVRP